MASAVVGEALAVWLGILVLAVANGMLREAWLIPALGKRPGIPTKRFAAPPFV